MEMLIDAGPKPFLSHTSKYLVLTRKANEVEFFTQFLETLSILSFAIVHENTENVMVNNKPIHQIPLDSIFMPDHYYHEKHEHSHKVLLFESMENSSVEGRTVQLKLLHFFKAVEKIEKCKVTRKIRESTAQMEKEIIQAISSLEFQMILNILGSNTPGPKLMTYDEHEYCPIVPIKDVKATFLRNMYSKVSEKIS